MSTDDAPRSGRSFLWVLATGAMTMAAVIVLGIVAFVAQKSLASLGKPSDPNTPPTFSASDWSERPLGDVVIEAPFALAPVPDIQEKLPVDVRGNVDFTEVFQSQGTPPAFSVVVTRAGYKPSLVVDLNRAVLSSIKNVAAGFDDRSPNFKTSSIPVGDRKGQMATYLYQGADPDSPDLHVDSTTVTDGPKLWQVVVAYTNDASKADAERILKSFQIR